MTPFNRQQLTFTLQPAMHPKYTPSTLRTHLVHTLYTYIVDPNCTTRRLLVHQKYSIGSSAILVWGIVVCFGVLLNGVVLYWAVWCGNILYGVVIFCMVWYSLLWQVAVWFCMVWYLVWYVVWYYLV